MYLCKINSARMKVASPVGTTWDKQGDTKQKKQCVSTEEVLPCCTQPAQESTI
jgi:hypothetical protein